MNILKTAYSPKGIVHFTVGAIIKKEGKLLLLDRAVLPDGFACVAGHVQLHETPEQALQREIKEEAGLDLMGFELLGEETLHDNWCKKNVTNHHWYIYECEVRGVERKNGESKSIGWYSPEEIKKLKLEPSWDYWLKKLKII